MFLKKGDLVDIISPASSIDKNELLQIKLFLQENGLKARFYMEEELVLNQKKSDLFPAFSSKKRFEQLHFALENKESKAIWCVRGGYGSADLIPFLQNSKKIAQNKLFIGFSDITALAIFLQQNWNWKIIYGPMLTQLAFNKVLANSKKAILQTIFGKKAELKFSCKNLGNNKDAVLRQSYYEKNSKIDAEKISATVAGGCLSVVMQSIGTANEINFKDKILLLEDIDETGEKIARYFEQILQIMANKNQYPKAILLGNFLQNVTKKAKKQNIEFAIAEFVAKIAKKTVILREKQGKIGHSTQILPIILG